MKKNPIYSGLVAIATLSMGLMSCSSDLTEQDNRLQQNAKTISLTSASLMRAASDLQEDQISTSVEVGAFGIAGGTAVPNGINNQYKVESTGALTATNEMEYPTTGDDVNIYAYAPYNEAWTNYSADQSFTVKADQSGDADYLASDLLYGVPTTNPVSNGTTSVTLGFKHKMSKVNVIIKKKEGATTSLAGAVVTITNTVPTATFNLSTGVVAKDATSTATDITVATIASDDTPTNSAVIVPQTLAANTRFVKIALSDGVTSLIAKLGAETKFEAGKAYNFTVTVGDVTPGTETVVEIKLGSTSITGWEPPVDLGAAKATVGDYVLSDGTFLKSEDVASADDATKAKIVAVIFSTEVSDTDKSTYEAYAMGLTAVNGKSWGSSSDVSDLSNVNTLANAIKDLDGLTETGKVLALEDKSAFTAFTNVAATGGTTTGTNLSDWFLPSIGQFIKILNTFGGTKIAAEMTSQIKYQSYQDKEGSTEILADVLVTNMNKYFTAVGKTGVFATSKVFVVSTPFNAANSWLIGTSVQSQTNGWEISNGQKIGNSRNILPCIAIKDLTIITTE